MAMNVAAMNNMATKSQMVGFVPNQQKMQEVKKEQEHSTTVTEMEKQDTSNSSTKGGGDNPNAATDAAQSRAQQAANQARRRQISLPEKTERHEAESSSESKEQHAPQGAAQSTGSGLQRGLIPLDNTARINFQFQAQQRAAAEAGQADNPSQRPEAQKRQFLTRLRSLVSLEYQQYVKSDSNLYTRRNLREIAAALGDQGPSYDPRKAEDASYSHRDVFGEEYEGFNKFNQMRATRTVATMQKYLHEPPQDQLSLVA